MTRLVAFNWNCKETTVSPVFVPCLACGRMINETHHGVADLDGPAYRAYYHVECAPEDSR